MKERKYKEDYRLEMRIDERGREKREAVYRGEWFSLDGKAAQKRSLTMWTGITAGLFAVFYLLYLEWNTPSTRSMYVFPIAACALAPLVYWVMGVWAMAHAPAQMTRVQKEKGIGRVLRSAVTCAVLIGTACVGDLVYMLAVLGENAKAEWMGFGLLMCAAASAMGCFVRVRDAYRRIRSLGAAREEEEK